MSKKTVLVAFRGEIMCFAHVLLHALDFHAKGYDVKVVIEGMATGLLPELDDETKPFGKLYVQVREKGLIHAVCRACAMKTGGLESAEQQGLPLNGEMSGHPALEPFVRDGYALLTF